MGATIRNTKDQASSAVSERFKSYLLETRDFPSPGIAFKDISPVLAQRGLLADSVSLLEPTVAPLNADVVLAIDARGFVLGAALAERLACGFVMVRKPGKLPGPVQSFDYTCEYCTGKLEVTEGLICPSMRCLIVDDLLATGGTAFATSNFVRRLDARVVGYGFLVEIKALSGRQMLTDAVVASVFPC